MKYIHSLFLIIIVLSLFQQLLIMLQDCIVSYYSNNECSKFIVGDFEPDCDVDIFDLGVFSQGWLSNAGQPAWDPTLDISYPKDGVINMLDMAVLINNWTGKMP